MTPRKQLLKEKLDSISVSFNKKHHQKDTLGKEGKCSRSVNCKSGEEPKVTVFVRVSFSQVKVVALCKSCYLYSPYSLV